MAFNNCWVGDQVVPPGPRFPAPSAPCPSLLAPSLTGLSSWYHEDHQSFLSTSYLRSTGEKVSPKWCLVLVLNCTGSNLSQSVCQDREYAQPLAWNTGSWLRRMSRSKEGDCYCQQREGRVSCGKNNTCPLWACPTLPTSKCLLCWLLNLWNYENLWFSPSRLLPLFPTISCYHISWVNNTSISICEALTVNSVGKIRQLETKLLLSRGVLPRWVELPRVCSSHKQSEFVKGEINYVNSSR